jgi:hypothetical protein
MYYEVIDFELLNEYKIRLRFKDGKSGIIDFSDYLNKGGIFSKFSDINFFRDVLINPEFGALLWPGGIDIAPETIYSKATGEPLPEWIEAPD